MNRDSFTEKWEKNAEDLLNNGQYEMATRMIKPYEKVLEIGCGTGQSTLSLLRSNHLVFSVDFNKECVRATEQYVGNEDWEVEVVSSVTGFVRDASFLIADIFDDRVFCELSNLKSDCIALWFPGQNMDDDNNFKIIDRCVCLSKVIDCPIQIMERAKDEKSGITILEDISRHNGVRLINKVYRKIKWNQNGIRLKDIKTDTICSVVGLFITD